MSSGDLKKDPGLLDRVQGCEVLAWTANFLLICNDDNNVKSPPLDGMVDKKKSAERSNRTSSVAFF